MYSNSGLEIICGPMRSGKTTELRRRLGVFSSIGFKVLYVNSSKDTRQGPEGSVAFSTHNSELSGASRAFESQKVLFVKDIEIADFDVIGIDEAQFFKEKDFAERVLVIVRSGKRVIVSGLDGDFEQKKMGKILSLIPQADSVSKLLASCDFCAKKKLMVPAPFTKRLSDDQKQEVVGNMYASVCRACL
ncbi:thymidine kinase [Tokyovirus A1]|uniref:thymidine kinase n=1 Tax=Tokyovirus A1 TaxID=1826170 RepID=UPI0007A96C6A|nr:thymidine kinase [Tokyovirus A1]BAU80146.1 thymidine kinase [Tokyovirus A1]